MADTKKGAAATTAAPSPEMDNGTQAHVEQAPEAQQQASGGDQGMAMMMGMFERMMGMFERQQTAIREEMDRRTAESERRVEQMFARLSPQQIPAEERPAVSAIEDAEMAPYYNTTGGLIEPPRAGGQVAQRRMGRMVAFIPKEDPLNPKMAVFKGWLNGKEVRIRRGQVGMVSRGVGVDWAKNKHGHVVDIAAMQGLGGNVEVPVQTTPDFNLPDNWDGRPLTDRSTFDARRI